jgi:hypothetical protein
MYAMLGMERQPVEQAAEYVAYVDKLAFETRMMLDSLERNAVLSSSVGVIAHTGNEEALGVPGNVPHTPLSSGPHGTVEPVFHATPTGRRARGQLEYDVLKICDDFAHDVYEWEYCTPKNVAEEIGKMHATEPPSTGAINAVWDRWEKLGFAVQDKKPSRFVKFEIDGSIQTLDMLKIRARRDKKMGKAEAKRGTLRPRGR